ncbi:D-glycerate dehydrogenase [Paenibacillus sp. 1011MAR3C5]|uniref:2-hydroxyacid dehydrogenase n=1 Tax=Paenibacillus sp. 1011MAR3C5 TaxID=1675787 RepID=UPI000E6C7BB5|nr:D-glycerate dehydrogenase [Paenibacillus sp. 1011MAR3C5]RJE90231.1 D-glycerate dehydrogenase [Paenibacillus sp. 1011MAR3C5]
MKPSIFVDYAISDAVMDYLLKHCTVDAWREEDTAPREELYKRLSVAEGYLTGGRRIDDALLEAAPKLKVVSTVSVGYNHFDIAAMKRHGVTGTHTPEVLDETVADLVFALMLGSARKVAELDRYVRDGLWKRGDVDNLFGMDVHHATVGIIGMGRIGEAVARRAAFGFGMTVNYHNRSRKPEAEAKYGATYMELDELLAASDYVVLLAPLTNETRGMIGKREFGWMKPSAIFINASRGATIDEEALIEALQKGTIRAAGLDVYQQEPLPADHPLLALPNALLLPHIGSATAKTREEMAMLAARNLVAVLQGEEPPHRVPEFKS